MKRLVALCGALVLTLAMAVPAAADQKVRIPEPYSGEDAWVSKVSKDETGNPDWWWEGWACTDTVWYKGEFKGDLWFWYPKGVDTTDPEEYMPEGEPWPWKRGMFKNKGVDTYASNKDFSGKVLRSTLRLTEKMYDHQVNGDVETWKAKLTGKDWNLSAPGYGWIFKFVPNWRYTVTITDGMWEFSDFVGKGTMVEVYDYDALCDFFGAGPAVFWDPED